MRNRDTFDQVHDGPLPSTSVLSSSSTIYSVHGSFRYLSYLLVTYTLWLTSNLTIGYFYLFASSYVRTQCVHLINLLGKCYSTVSVDGAWCY